MHVNFEVSATYTDTQISQFPTETDLSAATAFSWLIFQLCLSPIFLDLINISIVKFIMLENGQSDLSPTNADSNLVHQSKSLTISTQV